MISIIVTTKNNREVIGRTMRSIEVALRAYLKGGADTGQDDRYEIIFVDDGSSDSTDSIIEDWLGSRQDSRLFRLRGGSSAGCSRNFGAARARGDLLFFLDGDDLFLENHLVTCVEALKGNSAEYVKTGVILSDPVHPTWHSRITNSLVINMCIRRSSHININGFPDFHLFHRSEGAFCHKLDIFFGIEDVFYNLLARELLRGVTVATPTVKYIRYPGNSFDRQYQKFLGPSEPSADLPPDPRAFQIAMGRLIVDEAIQAVKRGVG